LKAPFKEHGYDCFTVPEVGWAGRKNGELLALAEKQFDVLITVDKNIRHQQNLTSRNLAVLVIRARSGEIDDLLVHVPACIAALPYDPAKLFKLNLIGSVLISF
jgi:hypothetical protein